MLKGSSSQKELKKTPALYGGAMPPLSLGSKGNLKAKNQQNNNANNANPTNCNE